MSTAENPSTTSRSRFLDLVERVGNALPDPVSLFFMGTLTIFGLSWLAAQQGWRSILTGEGGATLFDEVAVNLASAEQLRWLSTNLVSIFTAFAPLGPVLAAAIGIAIAEKSGLITAALKAILVLAPKYLLTPATIFAGVMSSMALDAGYIVLPPLAAAIYKAAGRSPLAGIAAVFAGVGAGFNANLFITGLEPILAGMTEEAAQTIDPDYAVNAACNWYFMIGSTLILTLVGWFVSARFVEPRLAARPPEEGGPPVAGAATEDGEPDAADELERGLTGREKVGLLVAFLVSATALWGLYECWANEWGFLYDAPGVLRQDGGTQPFPTWVSSIIPLLIVLFLLPGLAYGLVVGTIRSDRDIARMMSEYLGVLGNYIVLAFFAAIFVECFKRSNLDKMLAVEGGAFLRQLDMPSWALMIAFIPVVGFSNMFIGSMSAKWTMLSQVFVPMFMLVGIAPELTQVTYRIGDSITNPITPLNPYMIIMLVFLRQHVKKGGLGTMIAPMLPYALWFGLTWAVMLVIWMLSGQPLGPGGPLSYEPPL